MRSLLWIFIALFLVNCGGQKEIVQQEDSPPQPSWISSRPISSTYYTGIGLTTKSPGVNFQKVAKENALNDLASEIEVNVSSNSLLYTLEREYKFEQEFRETIRTQTNINLEDFEIVDSWEDQNSYWVYYRLDKALYLENLSEKKETAQDLAIDFLSKAETAKNTGQYATSCDFYLRGLQAIEEFSNEENKVSYAGREIQLANELFSGLTNLLSSPSMVYDNDINLTFQNRFKTEVSLRVASAEKDMPFENAPIVYEYYGLYGRIKSKTATNADGRINIQIGEADRERSQNVLEAKIDTETLFEPYRSDKFMDRLTKSLRAKSVQKNIIYTPPSVYIESTEKNLGKAMGNKPITSAVMTSLGRRDIRFANTKSEADLTLKIDADTKKSGQAQGFSTCHLNIDISLVDNSSGEKRYQSTNSNVKGVDLNYEKAGLKAYTNLTKNIESELMRKLVNDIF